MGYTPELNELIKRVESTRPERVEMARRNEHCPTLSLEEREEVLNKYHPDYQKEGRRVVKVGPNKGDLFQDEVADLLESRSMIRPENVDLTSIDYDTDILIIGGGGASLTAFDAFHSATSCCFTISDTSTGDLDLNTLINLPLVIILFTLTKKGDECLNMAYEAPQRRKPVRIPPMNVIIKIFLVFIVISFYLNCIIVFRSPC